MDKMMSQKEAIRAQVMELLAAGKIDQQEAGKRLAVSVRQIKRILINSPNDVKLRGTALFRPHA